MPVLGTDGMDPEIEFVVLQTLANASPVPLGSWKICAELQEAGIGVSEATAGRILRQMDIDGLTQSLGNKGRILTEKGSIHLKELEIDRERRILHESFLAVTSSGVIEDVLGNLHARRIIEMETSRLAALNATEDELRQMEQAARWHAEHLTGSGGKPGQNRELHRLIAQASRNRTLISLVDVLFGDQRTLQTYYGINLLAEGASPEEHDALLAAIRNGQADKAAEAMNAHISHLINVVQEYTTGLKDQAAMS